MFAYMYLKKKTLIVKYKLRYFFFNHNNFGLSNKKNICGFTHAKRKTNKEK